MFKRIGRCLECHHTPQFPVSEVPDSGQKDHWNWSCTASLRWRYGTHETCSDGSAASFPAADLSLFGHWFPGWTAFSLTRAHTFPEQQELDDLHLLWLVLSWPDCTIIIQTQVDPRAKKNQAKQNKLQVKSFQTMQTRNRQKSQKIHQN